MPGAQAVFEPVDDSALELGKVVVLAILGQLAGILGLVGVAFPVNDDFFHGEVTGQVLIETVDPPAKEKEGRLLVGAQASAFEIFQSLSSQAEGRIEPERHVALGAGNGRLVDDRLEMKLLFAVGDDIAYRASAASGFFPAPGRSCP